MTAINLREHQVAQKAAFRRWSGFPARPPVPPQGARGTIVSATGSGKTIMAAASALECFPDGRILVTVPTLDLLVQTAQAWRAVGHRAPMVAVCSLENDAVLNSLGVRTTTNPIQLALWAGSGPVVVLATYASLVDREDVDTPEGQRKVRGPLEAALAGGERLYGQQMAPFDLTIVDEAHSTTGELGRPWAAIHDNQRIPSAFRLYLTATPRILAAARPRKGTGGQEAEIASMADDPDGLFGAWLPGAELGLSEAIEREILAGFEIDVLEIRDPAPVVGESEEARRGRRLALLQTALLEHAAAHNLRTTMTFHQKVEEARAFADKLPETAADLYLNDASDADLAAADKLPKSSIDAAFYELEAGRHVPPDRVWSAWLCGDHLVAERREVLRQFANGIDAAGRRVHRAFLASVRVLGEGVDITGERGVDSICFADTRGSQVEIVQNIGRALRLNRDGSTKVARIIVPVFLEPNEDPTDMVASASFRPLVAVLQGLRSHDERLVEQLASRALTSGKRTVHVQRDEDGRIVGAGGEGNGEDQEPGDDTDAAAESALLHFSTPRDAATIAAFLRTRVYRPESLAWLEGYQALIRWRSENEITGVHAVPYEVEVEVGATKSFPLGRWVHQQRKALRAGELDPHRKELLDAPEAGMVWEPGEEAWENKLAALRSYRQATGHLAPRQDAVWGEGEAMVPIGQHLANLRRKGGLGKDPKRAAERAAQLTEIDPDWNCPWSLNWQRHYRVLADLVDADGALPYIAPGVYMDGDDIGAWRWKQQNADVQAQLMPEQRERLAKLGIPITEPPSPAPAAARTAKGPGKGPSKAQQAFQRGLTALEQWVEEGQRPVPRGAVVDVVIDGETVPVRLGVWLSNVKARRDKLTSEQRAGLAALGMEWAGPAPAPEAEAAPEPPVQESPPAPSAASVKRAVREHHEECDGELYEGGTCTCDLIGRFGPPSEREDPYWDNL
ncbi:Helicase associated domain protein [Streptomyces californicus]|uniref:DEAD/DEAH box helicase n=1 Tax=Streptomyces californicus TaxID=67351 RepID=UPI00296E2D54|nr:Helicase associated domain protein [Streptomyces californicus]MDW4903066.1 Helicase associated domain protein [Streptomyces californicus]